MTSTKKLMSVIMLVLLLGSNVSLAFGSGSAAYLLSNPPSDDFWFIINDLIIKDDACVPILKQIVSFGQSQHLATPDGSQEVSSSALGLSLRQLECLNKLGGSARPELLQDTVDFLKDKKISLGGEGELHLNSDAVLQHICQEQLIEHSSNKEPFNYDECIANGLGDQVIDPFMLFGCSECFDLIAQAGDTEYEVTLADSIDGIMGGAGGKITYQEYYDKLSDTNSPEHRAMREHIAMLIASSNLIRQSRPESGFIEDPGRQLIIVYLTFLQELLRNGRYVNSPVRPEHAYGNWNPRVSWPTTPLHEGTQIELQSWSDFTLMYANRDGPEFFNPRIYRYRDVIEVLDPNGNMFSVRHGASLKFAIEDSMRNIAVIQGGTSSLFKTTQPFAEDLMLVYFEHLKSKGPTVMDDVIYDTNFGDFYGNYDPEKQWPTGFVIEKTMNRHTFFNVMALMGIGALKVPVGSSITLGSVEDLRYYHGTQKITRTSYRWAERMAEGNPTAEEFVQYMAELDLPIPVVVQFMKQLGLPAAEFMLRETGTVIRSVVQHAPPGADAGAEDLVNKVEESTIEKLQEKIGKSRVYRQARVVMRNIGRHPAFKVVRGAGFEVAYPLLEVAFQAATGASPPSVEDVGIDVATNIAMAETSKYSFRIAMRGLERVAERAIQSKLVSLYPRLGQGLTTVSRFASGQINLNIGGRAYQVGRYALRFGLKAGPQSIVVGTAAYAGYMFTTGMIVHMDMWEDINANIRTQQQLRPLFDSIWEQQAGRIAEDPDDHLRRQNVFAEVYMKTKEAVQIIMEQGVYDIPEEELYREFLTGISQAYMDIQLERATSKKVYVVWETEMRSYVESEYPEFANDVMNKVRIQVWEPFWSNEDHYRMYSDETGNYRRHEFIELWRSQGLDAMHQVVIDYANSLEARSAVDYIAGEEIERVYDISRRSVKDVAYNYIKRMAGDMRESQGLPRDMEFSERVSFGGRADRWIDDVYLAQYDSPDARFGFARNQMVDDYLGAESGYDLLNTRFDTDFAITHRDTIQGLVFDGGTTS